MIFLNKVVCSHGSPKAIVSSRNNFFTVIIRHKFVQHIQVLQTLWSISQQNTHKVTDS